MKLLIAGIVLMSSTWVGAMPLEMGAGNKTWLHNSYQNGDMCTQSKIYKIEHSRTFCRTIFFKQLIYDNCVTLIHEFAWYKSTMELTL